MTILYTRSAAHLADRIPLSRTLYTIKQFSDGELYLKLNSSLAGKSVWIVTSTQPPADNLLELFLLLDLLHRQRVGEINLLFTYFGYARQSDAQKGEAFSAAFIADTLDRFSINKVTIIHAHAADQLQGLFSFENRINFDFFCDVAQEYDTIAAPDQGAAVFARQVAHRCHKNVVFLRKTRPEHERVVIESLDGSVNGKRVLLVDDIIATGNTLIAASEELKKAGATIISAAATHGVFCAGAYERLAASSLQQISVTNTLAQQNATKIIVYDCAPFIFHLLNNKE